MSGGISKLETALIIIFAVSVAALLAQLFYVSWRRRVFRRQTNTVGRGGGDELSSHYSSSESTFSSKELLYFFCIRPERNSSTASTTANHNLNSNEQSQMEVIDTDLLKIQGVFGLPRFLFTVKEEERGNQVSSADRSLCASDGKEEKQKIDDECSRSSRVILGESLKPAEESAAVVEIDDIGEYDTTPFSTPCASPVYFTPSPSPVHDKTAAFERSEV